MQERTSDESNESQSFKGLLHARTQEFVEEVRTCDLVLVLNSLLNMTECRYTCTTYINNILCPQVLSPYFGGLIGFVKDVEPLLERGEKPRVDERRIQQLVRGFASDWKKSIETLNHDIMQSFTNFKNGTAILQVCEFIHVIYM